MATHTDKQLMEKLGKLKIALGSATKAFTDSKFATSREELRGLARETALVAEDVHHRCIYGALPPMPTESREKKKKPITTVRGS